MTYADKLAAKNAHTSEITAQIADGKLEVATEARPLTNEQIAAKQTQAPILRIRGDQHALVTPIDNRSDIAKGK